MTGDLFIGALAEQAVDMFIVEALEIRIDFALRLPLERREDRAAHPAFVLGQAKLVGHCPKEDAGEDTLLEKPLAMEVANEDNGGIALDGRAIEVENRDLDRLSRSGRLH